MNDAQSNVPSVPSRAGDENEVDSRADRADEPGAAPAEDAIVAEVRAAREAMLAAAGHDLTELGRRLRAAQAVSGHPVVTLPPKPAADTTLGEMFEH